MKIVYTIILGLALVALLKASFYFLNIATRNNRWYKSTLQIFPWIEVFIWIGFGFWVLNYLASDTGSYHIFMGAFALVIIIAFGWFVLKDFIAGAVIRSDQSLEPGLEIKTKNFEGTISNLGYISMDVLTTDGEKMRIPYSEIPSQNSIRKKLKERGKSQTIVVLVPQQYGAQNIEEIISRKLLEFPWIIAEGDINITMKVKDDCYETEISFYSIKEELFLKTEELIRQYVDGFFTKD